MVIYHIEERKLKVDIIEDSGIFFVEKRGKKWMCWEIVDYLRLVEMWS